MRTFSSYWLLGVGLLLAIGAEESGATTLYGVDLDGVLYTLDTSTGAAANPLDTQLNSVAGISFDQNGSLFAVTTFAGNPGNTFSEIDPSTGASSAVPTSGLTRVFEGDLTFDASSDLFYGAMDHVDGQPLFVFTFDLLVGQATRVFEAPNDTSALAIDSQGELWLLNVLGYDSSVLSRVDKASGAVEESIQLDVDLGKTAGMAFHPVTGALFVVDGSSSGVGTNSLYTVDFERASLDLVGSTGLQLGLAGLSFVPIPEPSTGLLVVFGIAWLGVTDPRKLGPVARRGGRRHPAA